MNTPSVSPTADDLVPVYFRRKDLQALLRLASALSENAGGNGQLTATPFSTQPQEVLLYNQWKPSEFPILQSKLRPESAARTLLELVFKAPGTRVTFDEVVQASGKASQQVKADLAVLSRMIHATFGQSRGWPLHWVQDGSNSVYYATQDLADAWNAAKNLVRELRYYEKTPTSWNV